MKRIEVWADVGGTFADCFIVREGVRFASKVLSTGVLRCNVVRWVDERTAVVDFPLDQRIDGFWDGCETRRVDSSDASVLVGVVERYVSDRNELSFREPVAGMLPQQLELTPHLEAPVLATRLILGIPPASPLPPLDVRLGTTRGTNALLTRSGAKTALLVTRGFADVLQIGEQDRPELFMLDIRKPSPLTETIVEVDGRLDSNGAEIESLTLESLRPRLIALQSAGVESIAICLLNAYVSDRHEVTVEQLVRELGFDEVSRSSEVSPMIKLVARCETTVLDAYLNPILRRYVDRVLRQFGGSETCRLRMMTSGGHLVEPSAFRGRDSILSGPAGGIVSLQHIAQRFPRDDGDAGMIGLDMGGTSTDVSRYEGTLARRYESRVAGVRVLTPMMDIETVAAGGGSICSIRGGRLHVGPESAGADPGPACYGRGGPLTVTDVNVLLGRIDASRFPFALDVEAARRSLEELVAQWNVVSPNPIEATELAEGFLQIAVTHMAEAVRTVSTAQGSDVRGMTLVGFGGAAGQHLCRVAEALGMRRILDHADSSMLSALGMGLASVGRIAMRGVYKVLDAHTLESVDDWAAQLRGQASDMLQGEADAGGTVHFRDEADVRYTGTDAALQVELRPIKTLVERFHQKHLETFGYRRANRGVELVALRVDAELKREVAAFNSTELGDVSGARETQLWQAGRWVDAKVIDRSSLSLGDAIEAPSLVVSDLGVLVVEPGWAGAVLADQTIELSQYKSTVSSATATERDVANDPVLVETISRRLQGIADSMGEVLRRTSTSVNVKERRDYSCAVFRRDGSLVANAPHVPVHLGAMGHTVRFLMQRFPDMAAGDCYISNDPFAGGSHLPDVTVVTPVFCSDESTTISTTPDFFVASRAHHAEIGGRTPGSMPPDAKCLAEEGVLIRAFALVRQGVSHEAQLSELLASGEYPSRNVAENIADIAAQQAAGTHGSKLLTQLSKLYPVAVLDQLTSRLLDIAADSVTQWIQTLSQTPLRYQDTLDDGTKIQVELRRSSDRLAIDFAGTSEVHVNGFNATPAIVTAAVLYVLRCLSGSQLPLNEGVMRQIDLHIPVGLLNPPANDDPYKCAAVVAGNVETSQRIVDVLLGALDAAAASQGTMNNVLMGDSTFGYYETIGGGSGATSRGDGASGVHTHMTNTRITDPEVLESRLPVRLIQFAIRSGSGGEGKHRGGDGLVRRFEFLRPLVVSLITNRRVLGPYGSKGGHPGEPGSNWLIQSTGKTQLPSAIRIEVAAGDQLEIQTPGGGGWGEPASIESGVIDS